MNKCDVIIPIYNAYEYVKKCVESVIENTTFDKNKLILIDDKSPDKKIWKLLEEFSEKYNFIDIYQNEENLGFVATVNRGMSISKNDVVLLNSDTEVTKNWLNKLSKCAYMKENVATVTPLSNNATLASVPKTFEPNDIPDGYTLEEMGELVEKCSKHIYPEIPTGHGFCLYIKREVLDEIGLFDAEAYGKGYGEENDFCFRCLDHGYRNLLCDDTYIFHKESQSFSEKKIELQKVAGKTLNDRYPRYCHKLNVWCQTKPLKYIADNIAFELGKNEKHKNILIIIHDWNLNNLGGTTMHVYDLVKKLRSKYNFHVLTYENGYYKLYSYWKNTENVISYPSIQEFHDFKYYNDDWKGMVDEIVKNYNINMLHIHHMINHYFDIIDIIQKYNLKTVLSLHDYYSACPLITKMYNTEYYCGDYDREQCNNCLKCTFNYDINMIENWRDNWKKLFNVCDKIICPSDSCKNEIKKHYEINNIEVIEHGIDLKHEISTLNIKDDDVINVAFVGAIGLHKGSNILNDMITKYKNKKIKIHLFGIFDREVPKNNRYFEFHGAYKREELNNLLKENNIKLICLLSVCPETFSYTLSECVACGVPILGFNLGAIGERIKKDNLGWVIDKSSSAENVIEKIISIKNSPEEYNKKIISLNNYKLQSTKQMSDEYLKIYNKFTKDIDEYKINSDYVFQKLKEVSRYNIVVAGDNYAWVFNTLKWRIISKFKVPKFIKRLFKRKK